MKMALHLCEDCDICNVRSQPQRAEPKKKFIRDRAVNEVNICEGGKERSQKKFLKQRRVKLDEKKLHVETEIYTTHFLCAVNCAPSVFL